MKSTSQIFSWRIFFYCVFGETYLGAWHSHLMDHNLCLKKFKCKINIFKIALVIITFSNKNSSTNQLTLHFLKLSYGQGFVRYFLLAIFFWYYLLLKFFKLIVTKLSRKTGSKSRSNVRFSSIVIGPFWMSE